MTSSPSTVVYHVGAHKTGTSLVQKYFSEHLDQLRDAGIFSIHRTDMNDHVGLGDRLIADPQSLTNAIRMGLERPWASHVFVSHENTLNRPFGRARGQLYPKAQRNLTALEAVLRPHAYKIVISIRPVNEFVESYYLQTINQGRDEPFQRWVTRLDLDQLSWVPVVSALRETFGNERVEIVDFRTISRGQDSYLRHFLTLINPAFTGEVSYDLIRNASISGRGLQMALSANRFLETDDQRRLLRRFLQSRYSNVDYPRPTLFTDDQVKALDDRYGAEYEQLVGGPAAPTDGDVTERSHHP